MCMPKKIDKKSGSISYNRFEYQITQALNLAISLYDKYNYLIILEHYDDITLFENNNNIKDIHHYQVKTKNVQYTKFEKILKEGFLDNLIGHLNDNNINDVKEISLIINCRIIIDKKKYEIDTIIKPDTTNNILSKIKDHYKDNDNIDFLEKTMNLIISDISLQNHIELRKARIREFVSHKYQNAGYDALNSVVLRLETLFTKMQSDESLTNDSKFEDVKKKKGFSKDDFNDIIKNAIKISIPEFHKIEEYAKFEEKEIDDYKLSYIDIQSGISLKKDIYNFSLQLVENYIQGNELNDLDDIIKYSKQCKECILNNNDNLILKSYDNTKYIEMLCIILLCNKYTKELQ
ncbi:hypothetical protein BP951000_0557 [Brachyspira pilosicoli 95/1000]|uniref:CD-NTase associated protein 4-like DNA endonuclease domain-containing protein n=2 Tax=Brachyspira pilosicoli TaxID=52584 RepID=D8IBN5_BRAP9|nr:hypothetical protein BP951000_0557 [Brachyspira pilosicoli 95/1000]